MVNISITSRKEEEAATRMSVAAMDDAGNAQSTGGFTYLPTTFADTTVKTMLVGGIGTPVQHRRGGNIRRMLDYMHRQAIEDGVAVALLHPFSFAYYNQFGYERVADHLLLRFATRLIDFVPRRCELVPYTPQRLPDMQTIYAQFCKGRNLLLPRTDDSRYTDGNAYLCYEGETPVAYIVIAGHKEYHVNNYRNTYLTVKEMAYTTPQGLNALLSFLRMFEGEYDEIELLDASLYAEVDLRLRHYEKTAYTRMPDLAAKLLNTERLLEANTYPTSAGAFTLRVIDELPTVGGTFRVSYGGGNHCVSRLDDGADADITLPAPVLTRLLYANDPLTAATVAYIDGVSLHGRCEDLFRAFPHRPCGTFEHF